MSDTPRVDDEQRCLHYDADSNTDIQQILDRENTAWGLAKKLERELAAAQSQQCYAYVTGGKPCATALALSATLQQVKDAQAECASLKYANTELIKERNGLRDTCSDWDKAVSSLAALVMRYFQSINYLRTGKCDIAEKLYDKCVKRGDDERELVNENAKLRDERDALVAGCKDSARTDCFLFDKFADEVKKNNTLTAAVCVLLAADDAEDIAAFRAAKQKLREVMA